SCFPRSDVLPNLQSVLGNDVPFFAVLIVQQSDKSGSVRIVLNGSDRCGNSVFVAFKINNTIAFLMTPANIAHGHFSLTVPTSRSFFRSKQAFLRLISSDGVKPIHYFKSLTWGDWF